jgi:hypothetical protein
LVALKGYLVSVVLSMAVLQFWGFPACKTGDFHFAILGIFSLQETVNGLQQSRGKSCGVSSAEVLNSKPSLVLGMPDEQ